LEQKIISLVSCIFIASYLFSQSGCTDPQAINFSPSAIDNDGSCIYETTSLSLENVTDLSSEVLAENSGLSLFNQSLWTINDGGNGTLVYELDTLGNILREVFVEGVNNVDWEALTQNESHLFIGDFGNNSGNRQDLSIIKISKSELLNNVNDTVSGQTMFFNYGDQVDFSGPSNAHNYDCEAFIYMADSLYLFSKNWQNQEVRKYAVPIDWEGIYTAFVSESYDVDGLITDAAIDPVDSNIVLLGYYSLGTGIYNSFIWMLWDYSDGKIFNGNKRRIEIGNMFMMGQTEGISLRESSIQGYVSSEQISAVITIPPKLFMFNFEQFLSSSTVTSKETQGLVTMQCYPNPSQSKVFISNYKGEFQLYDAISGRLIYEGTYKNQGVDLSALSIGIYLLKTSHTSFKIVKIY
tara:strand:+ start:17726 stop:18952 length:1227 start_codon:yes stop_codon:yes gene_type:complete